MLPVWVFNITFSLKNFLRCHVIESNNSDKVGINKTRWKRNTFQTCSLLISCHVLTMSVYYFPTFSRESAYHSPLYLGGFWKGERGGNCKNSLALKTKKWFLMAQNGHLSECLTHCISFLMLLLEYHHCIAQSHQITGCVHMEVREDKTEFLSLKYHLPMWL